MAGRRLNEVPLYVFSDSAAAPLRYRLEFEPVYDDAYLRNHIEVNAADGTRGRTGSGIAIDEASTAEYGTIVHSINSQLMSDGERQALAEYQTIRYAQPSLRLPEVHLDGARDPDVMWPALLAVEVADPVTVIRFADTDAEMVLDLTVEGVRMEGRPGHLRTVIATSPRDTAAYMVADDPVYGDADSGNGAAP